MSISDSNNYAEADHLLLMNSEDSKDYAKCACIAFVRWCFSTNWPDMSVAISHIEERTKNLPFKEGVEVFNFGPVDFADAEIAEDFVHLSPTYSGVLDWFAHTCTNELPYYFKILLEDRDQLTPAEQEEQEAMLLGLTIVNVDPVTQYPFWENLFNSTAKDASYNTALQLMEMGRLMRIVRGVETQKAVFEGRCHNDYYSIDSFNPCWRTLLQAAAEHGVRYGAAAEVRHGSGRMRLKVQSTDPLGEKYELLEELYPLAGWTVEQGNRTMIIEMPWDTKLKRINYHKYYEPLPEENNSERVKIAPKMSLELDVITKEEKENHYETVS